jgi:hypothetical protein
MCLCGQITRLDSGIADTLHVTRYRGVVRFAIETGARDDAALVAPYQRVAGGIPGGFCNKVVSIDRQSGLYRAEKQGDQKHTGQSKFNKGRAFFTAKSPEANSHKFSLATAARVEFLYDHSTMS